MELPARISVPEADGFGAAGECSGQCGTGAAGLTYWVVGYFELARVVFLYFPQITQFLFALPDLLYQFLSSQLLQQRPGTPADPAKFR